MTVPRPPRCASQRQALVVPEVGRRHSVLQPVVCFACDAVVAH